MKPGINLFINPYEDKQREKEYEYCYWKNKKNPYIRRIIKLNSGMSRPTYGEFFKLMASYPLDVNIIANLDIYFDETLKAALDIKKGECYALTRWEDLDGEVVTFETRNPVAPAFWSQDAWIIRGHYSGLEGINFGMGMPGCDNRLAQLINNQNIVVTNPRSKIRAIHKHDSNTRAYRDHLRVRGRYLKVYPI